MLPHGKWIPWLTEQVEFSERTAQSFMRLAREWSNPQALADLGATKALALLALPPDERERFYRGKPRRGRRGKDSCRNDYTGARESCEGAGRSPAGGRRGQEAAEAADHSREKMAVDMEHLKRCTERRRTPSKGPGGSIQSQSRIEGSPEKPVEVAVEVDQQALEEARREAVEKMQEKVDKLWRLKKRLKRSGKKAEEDLAAARQKLGGGPEGRAAVRNIGR